MFLNSRKIISENFSNFKKNGIEYTWEEDPDYLVSKNLFLKTFQNSYQNISLKTLKQPTRKSMSKWLNQTFDQLYEDFQRSKKYFWFTAKYKGQAVGFLVIDAKKYPQEISIELLAVDPSFQGKKIASTMIRALFHQCQRCSSFFVITRRVLDGAIKLYQSLGFLSSSYLPEGHDQKIYTSFRYEASAV